MSQENKQDVTQSLSEYGGYYFSIKKMSRYTVHKFGDPQWKFIIFKATE